MTQTQRRVLNSVLVNTRTIMMVMIVRNIIDIGKLLLSHSPKSNLAIICRELIINISGYDIIMGLGDINFPVKCIAAIESI